MPRYRTALITGLTTAGLLLTPGVALAHNHLFNPSGACNANGGPGNADGSTNPAGNTPGNRDRVASGDNANSNAQAAQHCANNQP